MAPLILDASVLIGLLDTADGHHARAVDDVEAADFADHELLVRQAPTARRSYLSLALVA